MPFYPSVPSGGSYTLSSGSGPTEGAGGTYRAPIYGGVIGSATTVVFTAVFKDTATGATTTETLWVTGKTFKLSFDNQSNHNCVVTAVIDGVAAENTLTANNVYNGSPYDPPIISWSFTAPVEPALFWTSRVGCTETP